MTPKEIKKYIRYIADWRLGQLGMKPIYMIDEHPLPWLAPLLNGVEHANFFEQRATEYSKGATKGQWNDVWDSFDKRQKAKAGPAANEDAGGDGGADMFVGLGWRRSDVRAASDCVSTRRTSHCGQRGRRSRSRLTAWRKLTGGGN